MLKMQYLLYVNMAFCYIYIVQSWPLSSISLLHDTLFFYFLCKRIAFLWNGLLLEVAGLKKFIVQSIFTDAVYTPFLSKYMAFYFIAFSETHICSP